VDRAQFGYRPIIAHGYAFVRGDCHHSTPIFDTFQRQNTPYYVILTAKVKFSTPIDLPITITFCIVSRIRDDLNPPRLLYYRLFFGRQTPTSKPVGLAPEKTHSE
jgi:hypothetical protein